MTEKGQGAAPSSKNHKGPQDNRLAGFFRSGKAPGRRLDRKRSARKNVALLSKNASKLCGARHCPGRGVIALQALQRCVQRIEPKRILSRKGDRLAPGHVRLTQCRRIPISLAPHLS
jgi:hypothetical protein